MTKVRARIGGRIRARRLDLGLKQVELARACEISASYLNLIEHDRRPIGGTLLLRLAQVLDSDPARLSHGALDAVTRKLEEAAAAHPATGAVDENSEAMAQRYPGFSRLIGALHGRGEDLAARVEMLSDRLTHDPQLSAALHNVLSSVTAIRSASAILAGDDDIDAEWRARFHRNLLEDAQRLAETADGLTRYLDRSEAETAVPAVPQEEVEAWLAERDWHVAEIDENPNCDPSALRGLGTLSAPARAIARALLERLARDAEALPASRLSALRQATGDDPFTIAAETGVDLARVMRRLALAGAEGTGLGLVLCDASGTLTFRRPIEGFAVPRHGAACALWPVFEALRQPQEPVRRLVAQPGARPQLFDCTAIAEVSFPAGFEAGPVVEATMLIRPVDVTDRPARPIGSSCRVCPRGACPARREPSILGQAAACAAL